ncbi:MAG TPA: Crp/Fnr family transcriptional regulator [Chryseosolibacter sp.]
MFTDLRNFFLKYAPFSNSELDEITGRFKSKHIKSSDFLLTQGEVCKDLLFVQKGCLRLYYVKDEIEVSVWFSFEHSSAIEVYSFISGQPTNYFLQAIEDSEVLYISKKELDQLSLSQPKMQVMMKNFWEDVLLNLISRFTALQTDSAEKRYLDLLAKPPYMKAIPLKYLASFIGVTPTSLSRIRRQIKKQ